MYDREIDRLRLAGGDGPALDRPYADTNADGFGGAPAPIQLQADSGLDRWSLPIQLDRGGAAGGDAQAAAAHGTSGAGEGLPYEQVIQAAFGPRHDVSAVQAHVGGAASEACDTLGARGFASGAHVAFPSTPDLHTAAHEAAHVVQQRGGVQLKGGLGSEGDAYEQHADAVADAVVAGRSAAPLLDRGVGAGGGGPAIQLKGGPKKWDARLREMIETLRENAPETAEEIEQYIGQQEDAGKAISKLMSLTRKERKEAGGKEERNFARASKLLEEYNRREEDELEPIAGNGSSKDGLALMLRQVWTQRNRLHKRRDDALGKATKLASTNPKKYKEWYGTWTPAEVAYDEVRDQVYRLYNADSRGTNNLSELTDDDYVGQLTKIADERSPTARSDTQDSPGHGNQMTKTVNEATRNGDPSVLGNVKRDFFRFHRELGQDEQRPTTNERVYVNVKADKAPTVMSWIVKNIVDDPDKAPGVNFAKLCGPADVNDRVDHIVIYLDTAEHAGNVAGMVNEYLRQFDGEDTHTDGQSPLMTNPVGSGVSTGAEPNPERYKGRMSFGDLRARAMTDAVLDLPDTRKQFEAKARQLLGESDVDVENPHRNVAPDED